MEVIRVLGISGSPRHNSNTAFLVKEALQAAKKRPGVETEFIELAGRKIDHCRHCDGCIRPLVDGDGAFECVNKKDDTPEIYEAVKRADGVIIGSPVYIAGIASMVKALLDRMRPFAWGGTCGYKVGGAIAVAMLETGGGLDICLQDLHNSLIMLEFVTAGAVGIGAGGISGIPYGPTILVKEYRTMVSVEKHKWAGYSARMLGNRVAELSEIIKLGKVALGDDFTQHFCQSYHQLSLNPRKMKELLY